MRIAFFVHSLLSDWNHGNAHFLRGLVTELVARDHRVVVFEPEDAWSAVNLAADAGPDALERTRAVYPALDLRRYRELNLDAELENVDLAIVHEWNSHELVARLGRHRRAHRYGLLFHDTHHRSVSDPGAMAKYDLQNYDGVLAFGRVIRDLYLRQRWTQRAWVFHEAADVRLFSPQAEERTGDLVWVGNWGDSERTRELHEFLIEPARGMRTTVHGVRYPHEALRALEEAGIHYAGWLANYDVPRVFARHRVTCHIPRRQYATELPGIPTIRPFEAMACGIPLVSAPWNDAEGLFTAGEDYLTARDGKEMRAHLIRLLAEPDFATAMATRARQTILERHTCAHRADELVAIAAELDIGSVKGAIG